MFLVGLRLLLLHGDGLLVVAAPAVRRVVLIITSPALPWFEMIMKYNNNPFTYILFILEEIKLKHNSFFKADTRLLFTSTCMNSMPGHYQ